MDHQTTNGEGISPAKKVYSVEDITAALDMVDGSEYPKGNASYVPEAKGEVEPLSVSSGTVGLAGEEIDPLTQALQGFSQSGGTVK